MSLLSNGENPQLHSPPPFDTALEIAGSWGLWQKVMVVVISTSQLFAAMHCVAAVYLSASLNHQCELPIAPQDHRNAELLNSVAYPDDSGCTMYAHNYSSIAVLMDSEEGMISRSDLEPFLSDDVVDCSSWQYDSEYYKTTAVSEWNLVCSRRLLKATVQATFMAGILFGSALFGQISDRIGRRKTMLFCSLSLELCSLGVTFVKSYAAFIALRFVVALVCAGLMVTNFVLMMEITCPRVRSLTGMLNGIPFGLGVSAVAVFAFFLREWRALQLALTVFCLIPLVYFWILPESPRWLVSAGRPVQALSILKQIAKWNKRTLLSDEEMYLLLSEKANSADSNNSSSGCLSVCYDQWTLVRTPVMRRRSLISFFIWFVSAMVYYGLIFSGDTLNANPYLMVLVSGLIELPAHAISVVFLNRFGRRLVSSSLFAICSVFLLIIIAIPKDHAFLTFGFSTAGKFFNTAAFQLCFLYTSELMPTVVRNVAVGTSSMFARVGSSSAPYIIDLLGAVHYSLPSAVFGSLSLAAALLALLLAETNNEPLPQTVEQVEAKKK